MSQVINHLAKILSETYYEDIYQLPGSNYIEIDKKFKIKSHIYWKPKINRIIKINKTEILKGAKIYFLEV